MARYQSKAEKMFDLKFRKALAQHDFSQMEKLFLLLGCYYELIEDTDAQEEEADSIPSSSTGQ